MLIDTRQTGPAETIRPKPTNPYPKLVVRVLRTFLPDKTFRRYVSRHEEQSLYWWRQFAARVLPGKAILDIGAFHGEYALAAREVNLTAKIYAFEPNPNSLRVLCAACLARGITVVPAAIAEENGQLAFVDRLEQSCLLDRERQIDPQEEVLSVTGFMLDSWIVANSVVPALIKIDVEGTEAGIFRRAGSVLTTHRPVILCEILSDAAGDMVRAALPRCYRLYRIDENHGIQEELQITRRHWRNKNWLFIPDDQRAVVLECAPA